MRNRNAVRTWGAARTESPSLARKEEPMKLVCWAAPGLALALTSVAGCREPGPEEPDTEQTVGEEASEAAEETGEAVDEAGEETKDTAGEAGESAGEAVDEAEDKVDDQL